MKIFIRSILIALFVLSVLATFSSAAVKLRHIVSVYLDAKEKGLVQPEGVACGNDSVFVVADTGNSRLLRYTFQNEALVAGQEIKVPQLTYPVRVQIDTRGNILALDEKQRRIARLNPAGEFLGYLEPDGLPASSSLVPRSFKIDGNGTIYILDIFSKNVVVLDPTGKFLKSIALPEQYGFISDLAVDFKETVLLIDSIESVVYSAPRDAKKFSPLTKSMKENVSFATSVTTDKKGFIYLIDQNGGDIVILGPDGSFQGRQSVMGWKEGQLRYPSQSCISEKGEFFVADRDNNRVQIFKTSE